MGLSLDSSTSCRWRQWRCPLASWIGRHVTRNMLGGSLGLWPTTPKKTIVAKRCLSNQVTSLPMSCIVIALRMRMKSKWTKKMTRQQITMPFFRWSWKVLKSSLKMGWSSTSITRANCTRIVSFSSLFHLSSVMEMKQTSFAVLTEAVGTKLSSCVGTVSVQLTRLTTQRPSILSRRSPWWRGCTRRVKSKSCGRCPKIVSRMHSMAFGLVFIMIEVYTELALLSCCMPSCLGSSSTAVIVCSNSLENLHKLPKKSTHLHKKSAVICKNSPTGTNPGQSLPKVSWRGSSWPRSIPESCWWLRQSYRLKMVRSFLPLQERKTLDKLGGCPIGFCWLRHCCNGKPTLIFRKWRKVTSNVSRKNTNSYFSSSRKLQLGTREWASKWWSFMPYCTLHKTLRCLGCQWLSIPVQMNPITRPRKSPPNWPKKMSKRSKSRPLTDSMTSTCWNLPWLNSRDAHLRIILRGTGRNPRPNPRKPRPRLEGWCTMFSKIKRPRRLNFR